MRIIFLRHGESFANLKCNDEGPIITNNMGLTPLGEKQALVTGEELKKHFNITNVLYSPYTRAKETAMIINGVLKCKNITENKLLVEIDDGYRNGYSWDYIAKLKDGDKIIRLRDELGATSLLDRTKYNKKFVKIRNKYLKLLKAESDSAAFNRINKIMKLVSKYASKHGNKGSRSDGGGKSGDLLIVAHGNLIKKLICKQYKLHEYTCANNFGKYTNCHINVINSKTKELEFMFYNKFLDII